MDDEPAEPTPSNRRVWWMVGLLAGLTIASLAVVFLPSPAVFIGSMTFFALIVIGLVIQVIRRRAHPHG
ncbi:hypothetical protein [Agromyces atrinae]|uniref:Uncharacterized membrane protein YjjP (DUF1212 family) n=1 Tax=Agromyces atrinae TaxID=592376 RepID=A0A4Q2MCH9_9MICO|nr:hypothetical protein [Agromyces atrinae]NYD68048.1 uncharacterized membrane protein YjjP (DUF1212 family) [Agromyces atrinae]RXZ87801.1 hypothetical protein ESP50_00925 [Agromyces atrinae]